MANIKSQIKRNRQNETRHERNKGARAELKTRVKAAVEAAQQGADNVDALVRDAQKRIDMAAAKGAIHPNQAARRKARLVAAVKKAGQPG